MIKAALLVEQIDISQLGYCMSVSLNQLVVDRPDMDFLVFYESWAKAPMPMRFASIMEREAWGFNGTMISTNLKTTERMIRCPGPKRRLFYVWNLEWTYLNGFSYEYIRNIYCNPSIELIARSKTHSDLITKLWKKPAYIMENFDKRVLEEIVT